LQKINNRIQIIYGSKFGSVIGIKKIYKKINSKGDTYDILYNTQNGLFAVSVFAKNDNSLDILDIYGYQNKS
jgi:hypothetical protein